MPRTQPWKVSDEWREKVKLLVPPPPSHPKGGRPRMDDRRAFEAIIYVLRTGITNAFLAQLFSSFARPMGKENRELSGVSAPCMRSTHRC